jgi:6-phosphofructokinase 1
MEWQVIYVRIAIITSGGDAPGMNAAIRAVTRTALALGDKVYGVYDGYKGLIEGKFEKFTRSDVSETLNKGGTILGTARLPEFNQIEIQNLAVKQLTARAIDGVVCIGGDGTYRGALALTKLGIKCIGIPGTIDNDIASTDFTIGFSTALNTAVEAIDKLRDTSTSHQRCSIIEVMGRRCGDLALYSGICCGAEYIITDDTGLNKQDLLDSLKENRLEGRKHAIVVISENMTDVHKLAEEVEEYTGYECRATILGYVQRGGCPTPEDRLLASRMGAHAVELLHQDIYGCAIGVSNNKMVHMDFEAALNKSKSSKELLGLVNKIQ